LTGEAHLRQIILTLHNKIEIKGSSILKYMSAAPYPRDCPKEENCEENTNCPSNGDEAVSLRLIIGFDIINQFDT
jgi:hypothetical protein